MKAKREIFNKNVTRKIILNSIIEQIVVHCENSSIIKIFDSLIL